MTWLRDPAFLGWLILVALGVVVLLFTLAARWFTNHSETIGLWARTIRQQVARIPPVTAARRRYPRTWGFIAARISRHGYLGLHLTIGLLVSLAALAGFVGVVEDIADKEEIALLDDIVFRWLRNNVNPLDLAMMRDVSLLGAPITVAVIAVPVAVVLLWNRARVLAVAWLAALVGGGLIDWLLKQLFQRTRPEGAGAFLQGDSWSFPSGHAMGSLVAYGMLAYLACLRLRTSRARIGIIGVAVGLVLLIGLTRLYLGVHYFTDVIGGYAAGLVWLAACVSGAEVARRQQSDLTELDHDLHRYGANANARTH